MASKLWEKNTEVNKEIEKFTVGRDRELDLYLAKYDVLGSMAHITMLQSIGLLGADELDVLLAELRLIHADIEAGRKYMKVYKQMKMYNDPALNPVLYGKK